MMYAKQADCQDAIPSNAQPDVVSLYKPTCQESLSFRKDPWLLRQQSPERQGCRALAEDQELR